MFEINEEDYLHINASFSNPIKFKLTTRGLYSEVCCLLDAMVFALHKRRRLLVDETEFFSLHWSGLFDAELPKWNAEQDKVVEELTIHKSKRFNMLRSEWHIPFWINSTHRFSSVFTVQSKLAKVFCKPKLRERFALTPFAAIQLRRGDKTNGYYVGDKLVKESAESPIASYVTLLRQHAQKLSDVFVLTDDYRAFEEIVVLAPEFNFQTYCPQSDAGYVHPEFLALPESEKRSRLEKLVKSVDICGQAEIFIGPFHSNPSRFVPLIKGTRKGCFSTDHRRHWMP